MNNKLFIAVLSAVMVLSSCKKDPEDYKFSRNSVEENKAIIEDNGVKLLEKMSKMQDIESIDVVANFSELISTNDPMGFKNSKMDITLNAISSLKNSSTDMNLIFDELKASADLNTEPETAQEVWDEMVGTYTWNSDLEDWDITAATDMINFVFPADGSGSNNGELIISEYNSVKQSTPLDEEYTGDYPVGLVMELKVSNTSLIKFTYSASLNDEGVPSMVAYDLVVEDFAWEVDLSNNKKTVSGSYKFKYKSDVILSYGGKLNGDFTVENIENNIVTETETYTYTDYQYNNETGMYEPFEVEESYEYEVFEAEDVFTTGNAYFTVLNVGVIGSVNIKSLVEEMKKIDDAYSNDELTYDEYDNEMVSKLNKYVDMSVVDYDEKRKIADVQVYMKEYTYTYYDYYLDENVTETYDDIDFRFVFKDGSKVDSETYFTEGFGDVIKEINDMLVDLNNEYDADIDLIEY